MYEVLQRRLRSEWILLQRLAEGNPGRLVLLAAADTTLSGQLVGPPAQEVSTGAWRDEHSFRLHYPVHFPAVPMELYLDMPVIHPNVHPETGFVCLWETHQVSYTAEHAMHRLVAMLDGRLCNATAVHVMQPAALEDYPAGRSTSSAGSLTGVLHETPLYVLPRGRRRLS